ncbi:Starch-binding associating with outer membrane [compost metagenome]
MKSNIKKFLFLSAVSAMAFTGCKKGDDLYIDPNRPSKVTPSLLLTAIEVSTFNSYEGALTKYGSILTQQNAGVDGQALPVNVYNLAENEFDNQWGQLYQALMTCKDMSTNFGAENPHYSGISDVLAAMNWGMLTDLWGDIPFSDALKGQANNYQPKYDSQQDVIVGIINLLDGAIVKLSKPESDNTRLPGSDDLVFGGDASSWIKVAYSLKARYQNRLSNTSLYNANDVLASLANGITSSSEDLVSAHGPGPTESNQWYDFQNNRENYILASEAFVDSIKKRPTDERLYYYFDSTGLGGVVGTPVNNPTADASKWGTYLAGGAATGIHLVSFVEMKFIEAEVKARQGADASIALNDAIQESCRIVTSGSYNGVDIATYTSSSASLSRVMYEKWIAMFGSLEPYNDYRKTGLPNLTVNPNGQLSVIPKRYPTPQAERVGNPNAPVPSLSTPVWWAQ